MLEDLNKGQKVFMVVIYLLTAVSMLFGGYAIYNLIEKEKPWTLGVTYASMLETDDAKTPIISVNIHSNENKNGEAVYDFRINSYTDTEGNGIAGFGIQCVGDWKIINNSGYKEYSYSASLLTMDYLVESYTKQYGGRSGIGQTLAFGKFSFYYTGDDGEIYTYTSLKDIPNYMLISIEDAFYRMKLKSYSCEVRNDSTWAFLPWVSDTKTIDTNFTWFEVFDVAVKSAINSNAKTKYEEFSLSLFDLSDFITIQYKDSKGQYHNMEETSDVKNYFNIFVNYSMNGLTSASESIFGMVNYSTTWSIYEDLDVEEYWNAYSYISLTASNINYVYDESKGAYYATIDENLSTYLESLSNSEIHCGFDFTALDIDVYAIDLKDFDFKIGSFVIRTTVSDFMIYNQAFCGTVPTLEVV